MAGHLDKLKLIVIGDSGVGKTSFVKGIVEQNPFTNASSTIGCGVEVLAYKYRNQNGLERDVFLEFWEIGGSSGHRNSRSIFYQNANGMVLVHDLSNRKSFVNLKKWLNEVLDSSKLEFSGVTVRSEKDVYNEQNRDFSRGLSFGNIPILILGTKEDQWKSDISSPKSCHILGLNDEQNVFYCDMNCLQQSQLLTSSNKWERLNAFFERAIENRFYSTGRGSQENEYWRGRKKMF